MTTMQRSTMIDTEPTARVHAAPSGVVMATLRQWIEQGRFREGQPLPSERELAKSLEVARTTVRCAFDELQKQGLIEVEAGRRRRVVSSVTAQTSVLSRTVAMVTALGVLSRSHPVMPRGWDLFTYQRCVQVLQEAGLHALLLAPRQDMAELGLAQILAGRPMGMVVTQEVASPEARRQIVEACRAFSVPVVSDGDAPEVAMADRVMPDHEQGAYALTRWLLSQGCQRVVRMRPRWEPVPWWLVQRDAGYTRAMTEAGRQALPVVHYPMPVAVHTDDHLNGREREFLYQQNARTIAGHLLEQVRCDQPIDAVLAINDIEACLVQAALALLGDGLEKRVKVVGYDNTWQQDQVRSYLQYAPAATVDKCNDAVGEAMAKLLLEAGPRGVNVQPRVAKVAPKLVVIENQGCV